MTHIIKENLKCGQIPIKVDPYFMTQPQHIWSITQLQPLCRSLHAYTENPVGETEQHKQDATKLEHGLKSIMDDAALHEPTIPWKVCAQYLVAHGYAVVEAPVLVGLGDRPTEPVESDFDDEEAFETAKTIYRANRKSFNPVRIRVPTSIYSSNES